MSNPLQYSGLENSMGGGDWWATVHGVTKSQTQLSNFTTMIETSSLMGRLFKSVLFNAKCCRSF